MDDVGAVVGEGLRGIMLPKVERTIDVQIADWLISQQERRRGLERGSVGLHASIETARGFLALDDIACSSSRLKRIAFGIADFTLDTGMAWSAENPYL